MNELPDITTFVRRWPPFDRLGDADLASVCSAIEISYEPDGKELLAYGVANEELHLVRKGAVGLFDQHQKLADKLDEGSLYGYPSLLTGAPTRMAVRTLEDTLVYHIPGDLIRHLRAAHSRFDQFFTHQLADRIASGLKDSADAALALGTIDSRMSSPAVSMNSSATVADAAAQMASRRVSALTVVDDNALVGILTDRDFRNRVIVKNLSYDTPLSQVMTPTPHTCQTTDNLLQAQLVMLEQGVHHLPVLDGERLAGMITLSDLLRVHSQDPVYFIGNLQRSADVDAVVNCAGKRYALFTRLVQSGVNAAHVLRVMTAITDATTSRLVELALQDLGPAPMRFAWICLGSQARREQSVRTDQDNGLVLEREPTATEQAWFGQLATFVCDGLHAAGYVFCPGDIMAKNPQWRMSVAGWQAHFRRWITEPEPKALMFASIFFDQRCVTGERALVQELRRYVFELAKINSLFLAFMAGNALALRPPLSFFRSFILDDDGRHNEGLNLKHRGVAPIVALARLIALQAGIEEPETHARLTQAAAAGRNRNDMADLVDAIELIGRVRNEQQAEQVLQGREPTNLVPPKSLSPLTRRHMKAAFAVVRRAQSNLRQHHTIE